MNRDKLRKLRTLANFLDDLPHDKFHMPTWASPDATDESCGTAGCAAGWAATIFHKEGCSFSYGIPIFSNRATYPTSCLGIVKGFAEFFGISSDDANWITCDLRVAWNKKGWPSYCDEYGLSNAKLITPRHAADRIRNVIKRLAPELLTEEPRSIAIASL